MNSRAYAPATPAWHLISLRPAGQHAALRHAAARFGARTLAVSPWRLRLHDDEATRDALLQALAGDLLVFTSPAAATAAMRLVPAERWEAATLVAVGEGTARVLRRHGAGNVSAPARMDSEGLLALPAMAGLQGKWVALVTAPGGRGVIAAQVQARGARLQRVDVYERVPQALPAATLARLQALAGPAVLAVSSGEALERVLPQLPPTLRQRWQQQPAVVASERLRALAAAHGFAHVHVAAGPLPAQLAAAAYAAARPSGH
ncbi:hypothetical protein ABB34_05130 [Stenotrophomonas daejeonensis]|uniref:Uroporphyrinogen-III synthase n=1 Tax=Stenotrophomonas daejeonensis TaxID=659018 RepID=A0A0R0DYX5_9GAMM|nr:uroporphyrinogen-III synthase [Stenotrophomonas daejeonensis]KRG87292.1 hypothetical protein ABB34_05130 [Stenotrophomonas daejeonensis]